jgi:hypothetical protein
LRTMSCIWVVVATTVTWPGFDDAILVVVHPDAAAIAMTAINRLNAKRDTGGRL